MEKSKAYIERLKVYQEVEKIYKYNNRFGTVGQSVRQTKNLTVLAKVYLICVLNIRRLKDYKKASHLYDSVTYSYLYTFKKIRDGRQYNRELLIEIRKTLSTIERCVRMIKLDHPYLFSVEILQESSKRRKKTEKTYGNEVVLNDD